jgi:retron-type reverse transcriptase
MYRTVRKTVKNKAKIIRFEDFYTYNINKIYNELNNKTYKPGKYNIFLIKKPKYRIVMAQNIKDKIINHLVAKYLLVDVVEKSLIDQNVATRINKGTHYGMKLLKQYLVRLVCEEKEVYALKLDIHKFFYSLDHQIIKNLLSKKIKDKNALDIIYRIVDSTDEEYVNSEIRKYKEKEIKLLEKSNIKNNNKLISEVNNIPYYKKGKGLAIGNMTSQILAIFYLNELDHYIKETLRVKYYIRYQDDMVLLSNDKEYLIDCLNKIKIIIEKYKLKTNNKTQIINVSKNGIDFLGFHYYIRNKKIIMKLRNSTKNSLKHIVKTLEHRSSYYAHLKHGNCYNLYKKYMG